MSFILHLIFEKLLTTNPLFSALTKVYEKANSVVTYNVNCPTWLHKYIIGKKGAKLQTLMGDLQKHVSLFSIRIMNI